MEDDHNSSDGNRRVDKPTVSSNRGSTRLARHRATLACDTCRSRRTKCDGARPACTFCDEHDIMCNYRHIPAQGPSKHDLEIATIRERLDHICSLLSVRVFDGNSVALADSVAGSQPPFNGYPMDESIISRKWRLEFPFMTVQTPSTMILIRLNPNLAAQLVAMERTDFSSLTPPDLLGDVRFQYETAVSAFVAFCETVHHWYPILDSSFSDLFQEKIVGDLNPSSDSCLVLLVAAVGSVARCSSITVAFEERPDACYIRKALLMLPNIHFEFGLRSVQCLALLSIYYKCISKPCQAHDYALMASWKAQALFKCHFYDEDATNLELLRRSFWSILLIESELSYHIDMPESNIWKFDDRILLPDIHSLWHPIDLHQRATTLSAMQATGIASPPPAMPQDAAKAYFLAEIAMCRMLRRCTTSVMLSHNDQEVYAPVIAVELTHQLERWYEHLPSSIRFERALPALDAAEYRAAPSSSSAAAGLLAVTRYLQAQFFSCRASIHWPAVYGVIRAGVAAAPELLADCARFYDSYADFVIAAAVAIPSCSINAWYLYASLFIVTMVAIEGARAPSLQATITPRIIRCFALVVDVFETGDALAVSPSLRTLRTLLRERVNGGA